MRRTFPMLLLLPLLTGGCLTHRLWTESRLDEWNEPAATPNLRLFRDDRRGQLLVVYDEFSERREAVRPRAFFLEENKNPQHPKFVSLRASNELPPVPVFSAAPAGSAAPLFAVTTNAVGFTVFSGDGKSAVYSLPVYDDGTGLWKKIAWTPVAVVADLTIIGGYLGCVWIYTGGPGLGR